MTIHHVPAPCSGIEGMPQLWVASMFGTTLSGFNVYKSIFELLQRWTSIMVYAARLGRDLQRLYMFVKDPGSKCTVSRARWPTVMTPLRKVLLGLWSTSAARFFSDGRPVDLDGTRMIWEYHRSTLDSRHITWIEFTQWTPAIFCQPLWVPYSHPLPDPERLHLDDARAFVEESDLSFDFVWLEPGMSGALVDRAGWETRCLWTWVIRLYYRIPRKGNSQL